MSPKSKPTKRRLSIHGPTPAERKWTRILERWRQSGLPGTAFCRKRRYPQSAFRFWLKEIPHRQGRRKSRASSRVKGQPALRFLPTRVVYDKTRSNGLVPLEVVVSRGRSVRVAGDFDSALLQKLLEVLEARA